jgi:hypothetical protein
MRKRTKKFEIRSTKLETNSNDQKIQRVSSDECQGTRNFPLDTRPSTLVPFGFRYSDFRFCFPGAPSTLLRTCLAEENFLEWFCQTLQKIESNKMVAKSRRHCCSVEGASQWTPPPL